MIHLNKYRNYYLSSDRSISLLVLVSLICFIDLECFADDDPIPSVRVDLDTLPEQFNNDKLPSDSSSGGKGVICYNRIGCYEQIPLTSYLPQDPTKFKTKFIFYSRERPDMINVTYDRFENCLSSTYPEQCDIYPFDLGLIKAATFKKSRRTIILIGGYMSKAPNTWEKKLKDIWLKIADVNVVIVDWSNANSGLYRSAAINTRPVSRQLVVLLYYLAKLNDLDLNDDSFGENIYFVGHSLGAHIAGFVGYDLAGKLGRITGLDVAGPDFDSLDTKFRLDRNDARFVDAMHTNEGAKVLFDSQYGTSLTIGHIDLYANDGRHQPACGSDRLGCSHKIATQYYDEFLIHHLKIKQQVAGLSNEKRIYRLNAYTSDSYEQFHNGSALVANCPITVLDNDDLNSADLNHCSIPIDYVAWFDAYRNELQHKHWINFDPDAMNSRKYYFYTSANGREHRDHYLIKIKASRGEDVYYPDGCDVEFDIYMSNGFNTKYKVLKYKLIPDKSEYEIIIPFLSADAATNLELAQLDSNDYFLKDGEHNRTRLLESLFKIFPSSISISGVTFTEMGGTKKKGVMNYIKDFFNMASSKTETVVRKCELSLDSLTIQPLIKVHRHLTATYSDKYQPLPDVVIIKDGEKSTRGAIIENMTKTIDAENPMFMINKVIIGPYDSSINPPPPSPAMDLSDDELSVISESALPISQDFILSAKLWLKLTLILFILILIVSIISLYIMVGNTRKQIDERPILNDEL